MVLPEGVEDPYTKDSVADERRKIVESRINKLAECQEILQNAAIYLPGARGNYDSKSLSRYVTWCNQATYDKLEETGVHTEAFYGKKGRRDLGYDVNANKAYENVANYIDSYAKNYVDNAIKNVSNKKGEQVYPLNASGEIDKTVLYEIGKQNCPIHELTPEEAQEYANKGYTVVAMWKNPDKKKSGHMSTVEGNHDFAGIDSLMIANIGKDNKVDTLVETFGSSKGNIKFYVDTQQTFQRNAGFKGLAYDEKMKEQSISISDSRYNVETYRVYNVRRNEAYDYYLTNIAGKIETAIGGIAKKIDKYIFNNNLSSYGYMQALLTQNETYIPRINKIDDELQKNYLSISSLIHSGDIEIIAPLIRGEITVKDCLNFLEEKQARLAEEARLAAEAEAARLAEQARLAEEARLAAEAEAKAKEEEEKRKAEEEAKAKAEEEKRKAEAEAKAKEEEEKRKAEEEAKQKEEEERKRKAEEEAKAKEEEEERKRKEQQEKEKQEQEERERKEQEKAEAEAEKEKEKQNTEGGNTSADAPKDEETETTAPATEDEPPSNTTPVTTGNDNGGSGGSGTGSSGGSSGGGGNSGNGGTPVAGGGTGGKPGGNGKYDPELGEDPNIGITSIGSPTLPEGFYVTRIAGLSSLNAAYEAAFEAGELDMNFFDEVSNLHTVQSVSLFAREELG